ncbi:hypothetical protein F2Q68_00033895 [Brassica cretica]|uniref:Uncharacterized protein n=1 Tax=Brassica cretica TaxID=69181 RepID=A0A8S9H7G7_BRACR|nr:hypothetical protein F2Q68_00033895 [Brassica cretica]
MSSSAPVSKLLLIMCDIALCLHGYRIPPPFGRFLLIWIPLRRIHGPSFLARRPFITRRCFMNPKVVLNPKVSFGPEDFVGIQSFSFRSLDRIWTKRFCGNPEVPSAPEVVLRNLKSNKDSEVVWEPEGSFRPRGLI